MLLLIYDIYLARMASLRISLILLVDVGVQDLPLWVLCNEHLHPLASWYQDVQETKDFKVNVFEV
jgi:hypothetical protein